MTSEVETMNLTVHPLTEENLADFFALHCEMYGESWCNCVAWHVPTWDGWGQRTAEQNLHLRQDLFARGEYDGYLLYDDGNPVAWCQCGPRDRLSKLTATYALESAAEIWAVTCF